MAATRTYRTQVWNRQTKEVKAVEVRAVSQYDAMKKVRSEHPKPWEMKTVPQASAWSND